MEKSNSKSLKMRNEENLEWGGQLASVNAQLPKNMLVEVTNFCNDTCIFCANEKCTRIKKMIDDDFARRIIEEAYKGGVREIGFYATGEPLLNKNLEMYISLAKKIGYLYTYITTNGALLDEKRAKSLIDSGIDSVKFSINASNESDYKFIHGRDDFNKVYNNLKLFNEIRDKDKTRLYVSCVLTKQTVLKRTEMLEKFKDMCDEIDILECFNQGGYMHELTDYIAVDKRMKYAHKYPVCFIPFNCLHITVEGYLTMCCMDFQNYLAVEDLNNMPLVEAWNSEAAKQFRNLQIHGDLKDTICFNCMYNLENSIQPINKGLATTFEYTAWKERTNILKNRINIYNEKRNS